MRLRSAKAFCLPGNDRRHENMWKKEKVDIVCHVFQMFPYSSPYPKYPTRPSKAKRLGKYLDAERSLFEREKEARTLIHITPFVTWKVNRAPLQNS